MSKEVTFPQVPAGTYIDPDNWPEMSKRGVVFCTNEDDGTFSYQSDRDPRQPDLTFDILRWELGDDRVFDGDPFGVVDNCPSNRDPHLEDLCGIYVVPPDPGWTSHWGRKVNERDPRIIEAGIAGLVEMSFDLLRSRWMIWSVYGSSTRFRCWGPATTRDTAFEGTFDEVVNHIKTWEEEYGKDYI